MWTEARLPLFDSMPAGIELYQPGGYAGAFMGKLTSFQRLRRETGVRSMKLEVTPSAANLFKSEWGYQDGDHVRVFVRYNGEGGEDNFAFGVTRDDPNFPGVAVEKDQLHFFMEQNDVWYMNGQNLTIDSAEDGIVFNKQ